MKNLVFFYLFAFSILPANTSFAQVTNRKESDTKDIEHLLFLAQRYEENLKYDSAAFFYTKAGNYFEGKNDWLNCVKNYRLTAKNYLVLAQYDSAGFNSNKALEIAETYFNPDNKTHILEKANIFLTVADVNEKNGKYDEELFYCNKALELVVKTDNTDSLPIANAWDKKGIAYYHLMEHDSAFYFCNNALKIKTEILGNEHPDIANSYTNIGLIFYLKGEYDKALEYSQIAFDILNNKINKKYPNIAFCLNNIGSIFDDKGDFDKALEYYKKALTIRLEIFGEKHPDIAGNYNNIGITYKKKGEYNKALEYFQKTLILDIESFGVHHPYIAQNYSNIGIVYKDKGEYGKALEYYQKALTIFFETIGSQHPAIGPIYNNIGAVYDLTGKYEKAIEYFEKSLEINTNTFGNQHPSVVFCLHNIGITLVSKKEYEKALKYFQKALKIRINTFGQLHPRVAANYNNIAAAFIKKGDYKNAIMNYQKGMIANLPDFIDTSIYSNPELENILSKPELLSSLTGKAEALYMLFKHKTNTYSDLKASMSTYELAFQLVNDMRNEYNIENTKLLLSEYTKNNYAKAVYAAMEFDSIKDDTNNKYSTAFDFMEKGKSSTLSAIFNESQAIQLAGIPDTLISKEKNIRNQIQHLETEINKEQFYNEETDTVNLASLQDQKFIYSRRLDSLISDFEISFPTYYKLKYSNSIVSIPNIQKNIESQTAILNYLVGDTTLFIAVVTDSLHHIETVPIDRSFRELVTSYYQDLKSAEKESFLAYSKLIYEHVIQPVKKYISGKENLLIIPDDYLYYLPFETLVESSPSMNSDSFSTYNYLIKNYTIQYHQSATLWYNVQLKEQEQLSDLDNLICFAPIFSKDAKNGLILTSDLSIVDTTDNPYASRSVSRDGKFFNPLPYSRNEVESIVKLFEKHNKEAIAYLYQDASESNFKTKVSRYKYIHISSHSFSNDNTPSLSGIVFSQNSLVDSTSDKNEDNILFAGETYNLDLNSDLVVLSSCESGMGKLVRGEGLITLSRGFMYTGTPNIIYSLWKVPDKSTNHLMYSFYKYILEGKSYAQALRYAKLDMIKNEKNAFPLFWSGFVLMGR